ncbi:hypothetical protein QYE76_065069 [Lolium multiflorum]|uniref:Reverse transcriptase Ty1/copia-type domain-containing protein n=1 Tax=Lolium multiflorum TaxID=4521 RepID=A0AAD8S838_LOLMU|nr:hypothetical protein QYE76_065069 [Lolium multiflorum]
MNDLGSFRYILRIEASSISDGFYISQEKYIQDLLTRAILGDEHTIETPMEVNVHLRATDGDPLSDPTHYRHLVGSLVYLAVTRPNISYHVHILSQFMSAPTTVHYSHLLRVLRHQMDLVKTLSGLTARLRDSVTCLINSRSSSMLHQRVLHGRRKVTVKSK